MNKNIPVVPLEVDRGEVIWAGNAINPRYAPISVEIDDIVNRADVSYWYRHRCIPASRDNLRNGLKNLGHEELGRLSAPTFLLEKSFGLSLSDQYWLKPEGSNIKWTDINYFTNDFSEDVGKALFDNMEISSPNLNSPCNSSDGCLKKKWIIINGKRCLVKGGSLYHQQPFNEVIASEICKTLGIPHIPYDLKVVGSTPCSICENFIDEYTELISANDILKSFLPNPRKTLYEHFVTCCERLHIKEVTERIDEMIVLDYIIGNHDRHLRNFGVIRNVETLEFTGFAPIFDSGTSLRYDTPHDEIEINMDLGSLPFKSYHSEQIELVKKPGRFELSKLKYIPEYAKEILSTGGVLKQQRVDVLANVLKTRIGMLDKALCKGHQSVSLNNLSKPVAFKKAKGRTL